MARELTVVWALTTEIVIVIEIVGDKFERI